MRRAIGRACNTDGEQAKLAAIWWASEAALPPTVDEIEQVRSFERSGLTCRLPGVVEGVPQPHEQEDGLRRLYFALGGP